MLVGLLVVVFAFGLAQPISALANTATRSAIGIAVAVILLSFVTMITRRKAMSQVVGFLSMENGLFLSAMSATYGMPMIVEFGVALDVLVAVLARRKNTTACALKWSPPGCSSSSILRSGATRVSPARTLPMWRVWKSAPPWFEKLKDRLPRSLQLKLELLKLRVPRNADHRRSAATQLLPAWLS
jgi:hypothetical protein